MEIYSDLSTPAKQQFEKLLSNQLSKNKIEEGKIIDGKVTKITNKYVFLFIQGLKSEPVSICSTITPPLVFCVIFPLISSLFS